MNKNCAMSLIQKRCPRKRFPCSRCGAKIVNAGLAWEISIPKYKKWYYMDPLLNVNGAATASPVIVSANRLLPFVSPETGATAPCKFDGPSFTEVAVIVDETTPASYGSFVQDFEWTRFEPNVDGWNHFTRSHKATVQWAEAIVDSDSGEVTTPGHWRIGLSIIQSVIYHHGTFEGTPSLNQVALGEGYSNSVIGTDDETTITANASTTRVYTPPDDYNCIIPPGEVSRWTRPVPTLPVLIGNYTPETVPPGYEVKGGSTFDNNAYPIGFRNGDYYAPPYIDVRHVPK